MKLPSIWSADERDVPLWPPDAIPRGARQLRLTVRRPTADVAETQDPFRRRLNSGGEDEVSARDAASYVASLIVRIEGDPVDAPPEELVTWLLGMGHPEAIENLGVRVSLGEILPDPTEPKSDDSLERPAATEPGSAPPTAATGTANGGTAPATRATTPVSPHSARPIHPTG